jgi:hypothetical protein
MKDLFDFEFQKDDDDDSPCSCNKCLVFLSIGILLFVINKLYDFNGGSEL